MSYKETYTKEMTEYQALLTEYNNIVQSDQYRNIYLNMPFEFLAANQRAEVLALYKDMGDNSKFRFKRTDDAISFYHTVVDTRKEVDDLLESASFVVEAEKIADKLNLLVEKSSYLPDTLKVSSNTRLTDMAKKCLILLPDYKNLLTKAFRCTFLESCIECLNTEGLKKMVSMNILKGDDLIHLHTVGTEDYKKNLEFLHEYLEVPNCLSETKLTKVVGTSHTNEDGTSRQSILKEMSETKYVDIACNPTVFTKDNVSKNAVEILWNSKQVGFLSQDDVDYFYDKYENPTFEATVESINGGGDVNFGMKINLIVTALKEKLENKTENIEKN